MFALFQGVWTRGSMPGDGVRVPNLGHVENVLFT